MAKIPGEKPAEAPIEPAAPPARVDERLMPPGRYEATTDDVFTVKVAVRRDGTRWRVVTAEDPEAELHEAVFRMWTFEEETQLKREALIFDPKRRIHLMNNDLLDRMKVQKLLRSWTFDRENPRLKLVHVGGVLSDESWTAFARLHRNIVRHLLDEMNRVLEFNA